MGTSDRPPSGFAASRDDALLTVRANMLGGVERYAAMCDDGTLHTPPSPTDCPPAAAAGLLLLMLPQVDAELVARGYDTALDGWEDA